MLTRLPADDAPAVLAPDRLLPQRDELLDPEAIAIRSGELGLVDGPVTGAALIRAKYRLGESLRVLWRLHRTDAEPVVVSVRAYADGAGPATLTAPATVDRSRGVPDPRWRARWWVFPDDRRLTDATQVVSAEPALARRLGLDGWVTSEVAEYAPERSLTVRALAADGSPVAYVKAYAPGTVDVERLAARYDLVSRWFSRRPGLATPEVLGSAPGVLALQALAGRPWAAAGGSAGTVHLHRLGQAIAHLHELPVAATAGLCSTFSRLRADRIVTSAEMVARARPDVAEAVTAVARRLATRPVATEIVLLHGDCHPGNAVLGSVPRSAVAPAAAPSGPPIGLIDLDQAGLGQPACDVASLLARIQIGALVDEHDEATAAALSAAFLDGYRQRRELPEPANLRWHLAATLVVERAIRAVNRLHAARLAHLPAIVERAATVLDGGLFTDGELEARP